jgi:hypothetical protein
MTLLSIATATTTPTISALSLAKALSCVPSDKLKHYVLCSDGQSKVHNDIPAVVFLDRLLLDLLPVLHAVSHVCQVHALLVVHVHDHFFEGFVAPELVLGQKDLLEGVGGVQAIDDLGVRELRFQFKIWEVLLGEGEASLGEALLAGLTL